MKARACQPISALNPYCGAWTIKAKVASKAPLRRFQKNGQEQAVFSIEVVDEQVLHDLLSICPKELQSSCLTSYIIYFVAVVHRAPQ